MVIPGNEYRQTFSKQLSCIRSKQKMAHLITLALFLSFTPSVLSDSLTAEKSEIYFVPGRDVTITWFYNVSEGSRIPDKVKIWAHLNNGSTESSLLWTVTIKEKDSGMSVSTIENDKLKKSNNFRVFHTRTQLKHNRPQPNLRYELHVNSVPKNLSLYDFSCVIHLSAFTRFEKKVKMVRSVKPRITSYFDVSMSARKGETVTLQCFASGVPAPEVTWSRLYDSGSRFQAKGLKKATLVVPNIQPESTGTYSCRAKNLGGEAYRDIAITVSYLEIDATYGRLHRGHIQKPLRVDCPILGYPEPDYSWRRSGSLYSSSKSLSFDRLSKEDFGNYTCTAFNQVGQIGTFVLVESTNTVTDKRSGDNGASNFKPASISLHIIIALIVLPLMLWSR